jgi:hypothetical protein
MSDHTLQAQVVEASLLLARGVSGERVAKWYGERITDQASSPEWRGLGLHSLMRMTLLAAGIDPPQGRFTDASIRAALQADQQLRIKAAGWGPSRLPLPPRRPRQRGNKLLLQGWNRRRRPGRRSAGSVPT